MKKVFIVILALVSIAVINTGCGGGGEKKDEAQKKENNSDSTNVPVIIKGFQGKFLYVDEQSGYVIAGKDQAEAETFTMAYLDTGTVSLKSSKGKYLCVDENTRNFVFANQGELNVNGKYKLVKLDSDKVALRSSAGFYVCADQDFDKKLHADRIAVGEWEKFTIVKK